MTEKELQKFKELLEKKAGELEGKLKQEKKTSDFGDDADSFEEEEDETEEFSNQLGLQQATKEELEAVENALNKIEAGTYGVCEKCKQEISADILNIDPESRLCKNCKKLSK